MPFNSDKVEELRSSANVLAKQALETAELGLRMVRDQFENVTQPQGQGAQAFQQSTLNVETKAKEMFSLATRFMQEINDKWQPTGARPEQPEAARPRAEKIDIEE